MSEIGKESFPGPADDKLGWDTESAILAHAAQLNGIVSRSLQEALSAGEPSVRNLNEMLEQRGLMGEVVSMRGSKIYRLELEMDAMTEQLCMRPVPVVPRANEDIPEVWGRLEGFRPGVLATRFPNEVSDLSSEVTLYTPTIQYVVSNGVFRTPLADGRRRYTAPVDGATAIEFWENTDSQSMWEVIKRVDILRLPSISKLARDVSLRHVGEARLDVGSIHPTGNNVYQALGWVRKNHPDQYENVRLLLSDLLHTKLFVRPGIECNIGFNGMLVRNPRDGLYQVGRGANVSGAVVTGLAFVPHHTFTPDGQPQLDPDKEDMPAFVFDIVPIDKRTGGRGTLVYVPFDCVKNYELAY